MSIHTTVIYRSGAVHNGDIGGSGEVAIRLTVQPEKIMDDGDNRFSN
jgi:hypothetical protein